MTLAEIQERFLAGIIRGDDAIADELNDSPRTDRGTMFAVYYNAYRLRLAEFLSNDFSVLRSYLGDETFGQLVEAVPGADLAGPGLRRRADLLRRHEPGRNLRGDVGSTDPKHAQATTDRSHDCYA